MNIRQLRENEPLPMELLLEADPSEELVLAYASTGFCYIAEDQGWKIGAYILLPLTKTAIEIKNIVLQTSERGKGSGKELIKHALSEAQRMGYETVEIGTGNSSIDQIAFYQKCGFRIVSIDRNFFVRHYPEPIFENGIQCRDMIRLEYKIEASFI
ncbi:GNAT family N-acetyltransferase [Planomicrobium sp. CPCC 101079]|uniref:GNAT family N-acetyltransferase n=1 Tax=Planomicrobium sp. CPCC 101079 TaxID=2599618 RepID=UPI0011B5967A|nr:GNAT family N-acetyltransferase [Planomicrobium sp. CPCC 101079]TWT02319.1 GNAT family N-acetyltransferase [Planomicrobium sp. CPCC 101079]